MRNKTAMNPAIVIILVFSLLVISSTIISARSSGPPNAMTGAPGESNCTVGCHTGNALNAPGGTFAVTGLPETGFTLGQNYTITVAIERDGQTRWGFEAVVKDANGSQAGTVTATDISRTQTSLSSGLTYIKHTTAGTSTGTWTFDWKAPDVDPGPVTIYAAGNAADGNGSNSGDFIYTTSLTSSPLVTSVEDDGLTPDEFALYGNYPNPFNPETRISFSLPSSEYVSLMIYDVLGREVASLVDRNLNAGTHEINWNAADMSSGTYFYRITAGDRTVTKKMLLVK